MNALALLAVAVLALVGLRWFARWLPPLTCTDCKAELKGPTAQDTGLCPRCLSRRLSRL